MQRLLIGQPHDGLSAMFTYMNVARIGTASQGVAAANAHIKERRLIRRKIGNEITIGCEKSDGPADKIVEHPDVKNAFDAKGYSRGRACNDYACQ